MIVSERSSLWHYVEHWREEQPDALAIVSAGKQWTWAALSEAIDACVERLREAGVRRAERIGMLSWQCVEFVITYVAIERLEATFVGLSPRYSLPELAFLLKDARPRVIFTSASLTGALAAPSVIEELHDNHSYVELIVSLHGLLKGAYPFERLLTRDNAPFPGISKPISRGAHEALGEDEPPICVVYTSGSSGRPKAARLPNRSLLHNYRLGASLFQHTPFRAYSCHPIDHIGGIDRMYQTIMLGGMLVLDQRFEPERMLQQTQDQRLTYWLGEATQFIKLSPYLNDYDLSSLRVIRYVGPLPEDVLRRLQAVAPLVMTSYGSSETCASLVFTDESTSLEALRDGNVGFPIDGFTMRVVDGDRNRIVGDVGELELRSEWLFSGYGTDTNANKPPLTEDGWFQPGDLFRENQDGSFSFVGRSNDVYKSGGYNVHPAEVEAALMAHPLVKEVCVIGVPDPTYIAVGKAFVVLHSAMDSDELRPFLRERLAGYKVPKILVVLDEMPLLRNDKIDRKSLSGL